MTRRPRRRGPASSWRPLSGDDPSATDDGAAAAELVVVLPAVVLVLALCLGAVQTVSQQILLTFAAEEAARSLGRGEDAGTAAARIDGAAAGAGMGIDRAGRTVCVRLTARSRFAPAGAAGLRLSARGCAWQEDADAGSG